MCWEKWKTAEKVEIKNCFDNAAAVAIIAEAEGINDEEMRFYGWEILENRLDLKYGSIKEWLEN